MDNFRRGLHSLLRASAKIDIVALHIKSKHQNCLNIKGPILRSVAKNYVLL
jgi:hypothetical protein